MSTSIRNRLPGTIEQIVSDKVVSEIVINTGAGQVTSIIITGSNATAAAVTTALAAFGQHAVID
jgi:molybdopterin-binding protein